MKKRLLVLLILCIGAAAGWWVFLKPVTAAKEVAVPYTIWRVGEQFNSIQSIRKWFSPFTVSENSDDNGTDPLELRSGDLTLHLESRSVFNAVLRLAQKNKSALVAYSAYNDSGAVREAHIRLEYKTTLGRKWFGESGLVKLAIKNLENLRDYMTDTKRFYGFEIQEMKVEDTAYLFSRLTVPVAEKRQGMTRVFEKLIRFAEEKKAGYNGTRIFYSMQSGNQITLFAGIAVTTAISIPEGNEIEYKRMPYGKNLLVTNYQGPFGDSRKAFEAMELFKTDHQLSSMAIPYQKFLTEGYDFADDQVVQLQVFYPVF